MVIEGAGTPKPLEKAEGRLLLQEARKTLETALTGRGSGEGSPPQTWPVVFGQERGTFVTLTRRGQLRGCIGSLVAQEPLIEGLRHNALSAAFRDPRFPPLKAEELGEVRIEVSVLTEPQPLAYRDADDLLRALRPGIDGVIIRRGCQQATFLPQVWEQLPDKQDFLSQLSLKAGLPAHAWRQGDLEVMTYQVQAFEEGGTE